jgi:hypothetical protein
VLWWVVAGTFLLAAASVWYYSALELTLSHYDAKAHLVVARRIFDSLTPGWRQIGAVWLPLPHLLNALPVQVDALYRSGASGVAISMAAFVVAVGSVSWLVFAATTSRSAAAAAAVLLATDPSLLYLQSTPMTEPLLLGLVTLAAALLHRWVGSDGRRSAAPPGWALAGACLTRYEAWPIAVAALAVTGLALWRRGLPVPRALTAALRVAAYPAVAIVAFLVLSRATVGEWFVTGGFFVVDNPAHGRPLRGLVQVWWGLKELVGPVTLVTGTAGALAATSVAVTRPAATSYLLGLALAAAAALPWYAFTSGHPFRIRYMAVLAAAVAVGAGYGVGLLPRRLRLAGLLALAGLAVVETPPFARETPLVAEAQWDRPASLARRAVTACLVEDFQRPSHKILASMGSLAHYMQELSAAGFALSDFVHEGVGELWPEAVAAPRRHVEWILFEEQAEGGDLLTLHRAASPAFVAGFSRRCQGGGVALYGRDR